MKGQIVRKIFHALSDSVTNKTGNASMASVRLQGVVFALVLLMIAVIVPLAAPPASAADSSVSQSMLSQAGGVTMASAAASSDSCEGTTRSEYKHDVVHHVTRHWMNTCDMATLVHNYGTEFRTAILNDDEADADFGLLCRIGALVPFVNIAVGVPCEAGDAVEHWTVGPREIYDTLVKLEAECRTHGGAIWEITADSVAVYDVTDFGCQDRPLFMQNVFSIDGTCESYRFDIEYRSSDFTRGDLLALDAPPGTHPNRLHRCFTQRPYNANLALRDSAGKYLRDQNGEIRKELKPISTWINEQIEVQHYINWFVPEDNTVYPPKGALWEAIWMNGHGFIREHPNFGAFLGGYEKPNQEPPVWDYVGTYVDLNLGYTDGAAQGGVMIDTPENRRFLQRVYQKGGACHQYEFPNWPNTDEVVINTGCKVDEVADRLPDGRRNREAYSFGPGDVSSYTAWTYEDKLTEALWRTTVGYLRKSTILETGEILHGNWIACCDYLETPPASGGQGGFVYSGRYLESPIYLAMGPLGDGQVQAASLSQPSASAAKTVVEALERYASNNGSYVVRGSGWKGGGQGWFNSEAGRYTKSLRNVLVDGGWLNPATETFDSETNGDFLVYRCANRIAVFSTTTVSSTPTHAAQWWNDNNCTSYPASKGYDYMALSRPLCDGRVATVDLLLGETPTAGHDVIVGTNGNDTIAANFGDDVICGLGGDDTISGNQGDDRIFGGAGNDTLHGGYDNDVVYGEAGDDTIVNNRGVDTMRGGAGNDKITGGIHADTIYGDDGDDVMNGRQGNDTIWGGFGADTLIGEDGNDTLAGNQGNDEIRGGNGDDVLHGGYDNDVVYGDAGNDRISNNRGVDTMRGGPGNDHITGGIHNDTIYGDDGDDALGGGTGNDRIWGGNGDDRLWGNDGDDFLAGNINNDRLWGGNGNDELHGGYNDDVVFGEAGDDKLVNNRGNDTMNGGTGTDTCTRGNGTDTLVSC